jgi:hypothetical protein
MLTDEGHKRIQDALLASVLRKLLAGEATYAEAWTGGPNYTHAYVQVDGTAAVTPEEAAAVRKVISDADR